MRRLCKTLVSALLVVAGMNMALAETDTQTLQQGLKINGETVPVTSVKQTPMEGILEVRLESGETLYSDSEGKHFVVGDLFVNDEQGLVNLTQQAQDRNRIKRLAKIPQKDKVIFRGEKPPKATLAVFTDVTCPYCRKLHEEVPRLNDMGIAVEYLAFPRSGLKSEGARLMSQVWCASNPSEAMSAIKRGETLNVDADCDNLVADQYHLGRELGVQGTPAIVMPDGRMIPGYVPADRLAKMLNIEG
ncbi:DsbC family protein [Halomonas sp. PR-M31]|uniref:DsbC family protein n=1 Tax=Halomonas sp. PR-M31 TaxID=1471202 RepID=UPI000651465E|nr:DsbC family protein [Halomonas sp. PR-M31]